jgi:mannose-1-phosphate guanylyltransferase
MAMHDYPRFNKVTVNDGLVTGFDGVKKEECLAFSGLHVLEVEVLRAIPEIGKSCIIDRYREYLKGGGRIQAYDVSGCSWTDMGTVDDYLALHGQLLKGEIELWPEFREHPQNSCLFHGQVSKMFCIDWACVGQVTLPPNLTLQRCVVWDGASLEEGAAYSDALLVPEKGF